MRKDTTFSDRKLAEAEFSEKYWLSGQAPYQYHTATIDDGRDEREQFLFNNCRALKDIIDWKDRVLREMVYGMSERIEALEKRLATEATEQEREGSR